MDQKKSNKHKKLKRKVSDSLLDELIMPNRKGASNLLADDDLPDESIAEMSDGKKIMLTPKGILHSCIKEHYGDASLDKCERLQKELVKQLSALASEDHRDDLLGNDFNEFFSIVVSTMNLLNKAINRLNDHGIEFDIKTELGNDLDENGDQ